MARKKKEKPPHVREAMAKGNIALLKKFARRGGRMSALRRARAKQFELFTKKQLEQDLETVRQERNDHLTDTDES